VGTPVFSFGIQAGAIVNVNIYRIITMSKYLIEIPHESDKIGCLRSIAVLLSSGSHFLTNADFGCADGEHKAWFFMDADNKDEVLRIVPPAFRKDAKISLLSKFNLEEVERLLKLHQER
jgi:hypothetical protein